MLPWRAVCRTFVGCVAPATVTAAQKYNSFSNFGEVKKKATLFVIRQDLGAYGNLYDQIVAISAVPVPPHSLNTAHSLEMLGVAKIDQCVQSGDGFKDNVSTFAAITSIGTTILHIFFSAKAYSPGAPCARANENFCLIKKMHGVAFRGGWPFWPVASDLIALSRNAECIRTMSRQQHDGRGSRPNI
jgi:hypothetical protein